MIAGSEEEEEEEEEDAAAAARAPVAAARLPAACGEEVKEKAFGSLGSSPTISHGSPPPLRRRGGLPGGFLEAGAAPRCEDLAVLDSEICPVRRAAGTWP